MSKVIKDIARCEKCALPTTYPGVKLGKNKICNYCNHFDIYKEREEFIKQSLKKETEKVIKSIKKKKQKYDCIVAYSGGKDSTFLLYYLKEKYKLNILAHTLDNGFIFPETLKNIKSTIKKLKVKHIVSKPPQNLMNKIFRYVLTENIPYPKEILAMMSPLCATCQGMVFGTTINLAIKKNIPLMFIGYTPGQYPAISFENFLKAKSCVFFSTEAYKDDPLDILKILRDPMDEKFGDQIKDFYFRSQYIDKGINIPKVLFPFHIILDYDLNEIFKSLSELGWQKPTDTDDCSTNCMLNTLANYACKSNLKYHPYIGELSFLVREGKMTYEQVLKAEKVNVSSFAMKCSLSKLSLNKKDMYTSD